MDIKFWLKKFFRGYTILEETFSPINGRIQVLEDFLGRRRLLAGGITQSGEIVEEIWGQAFKSIRSLKVSRCLILGLGGGSAAKKILSFFPKAEIVGIEIDREMIKMGKKYFNLKDLKNLKIVIKDAFIFLNDLNHLNKKFDLILVDLYVGDKVVEKTETDEFIKNIKKILNENGIVIFNRLYYAEQRRKTDNFENKIRNFFPKIDIKKIQKNKLFLCRNF